MVVFGQPVVPLYEPQVHFLGFFCQVSSISVHILLIGPPCPLNMLSMSTCIWVHKMPIVIHLVVNITVMQQSVIGPPGIADDLTSRSDIFVDNRKKSLPWSIFNQFQDGPVERPLHLYHAEYPRASPPGRASSTTSILDKQNDKHYIWIQPIPQSWLKILQCLRC